MVLRALVDSADSFATGASPSDVLLAKASLAESVVSDERSSILSSERPAGTEFSRVSLAVANGALVLHGLHPGGVMIRFVHLIVQIRPELSTMKKNVVRQPASVIDAFLDRAGAREPVVLDTQADATGVELSHVAFSLSHPDGHEVVTDVQPVLGFLAEYALSVLSWLHLSGLSLGPHI